MASFKKAHLLLILLLPVFLVASGLLANEPKEDKQLSGNKEMKANLISVGGLDVETFANDPSDQETKKEYESFLWSDYEKIFEPLGQEFYQLANLIIHNDELALEKIDSSSLEFLNLSFKIPESDPVSGFGYENNLLRLSVLSRNLKASQSLARKGFDVNYNDGEMAYQALQMPTFLDPFVQRVPFQDNRFGSQYLVTYLEHGGNPNAYKFDGTFDLLTFAASNGSLQGIFHLLEHGADPWLNARDSNTGINYDSFFDSLAGFTSIQAETAFRVAKQGYYDNSELGNINSLYKRYDRFLANFIGSSGQENLGILWGLQQALKRISQGNSVPIPSNIQALIDKDFPKGIGGFYLSSSEIFYPQSKTPFNFEESGTEKWDE